MKKLLIGLMLGAVFSQANAADFTPNVKEWLKIGENSKHVLWIKRAGVQHWITRNDGSALLWIKVKNPEVAERSWGQNRTGKAKIGYVGQRYDVNCTNNTGFVHEVMLYDAESGDMVLNEIVDDPANPVRGSMPVSYTHLTLPTKRIV